MTIVQYLMVTALFDEGEKHSTFSCVRCSNLDEMRHSLCGTEPKIVCRMGNSTELLDYLQKR